MTFECDLAFDFSSFFFFNDTAPTEIYTLSLHDALPTSQSTSGPPRTRGTGARNCTRNCGAAAPACWRSEEHTSELQSQSNLVCRLLLEKKKMRKDRQQVLLQNADV